MTSFYGEYRQKDRLSDEEENRASRENVDKWIFRLLLILIGFMPLVVMAHTEEVISPLISDVPVLTSGTKGDLFTYYKSLIVLVITVIAGLLLLAKVFFMNGGIRKTKLNYFLGAFAIAIVMSIILSPNITIALEGQYNRSDGAISWLCYIALMFIAINIEYPKKVVQYVAYAFSPFILINLIITSMNFFGNDLLQYSWVQKIITLFLPAGGGSISQGSTLLGTLNHGNYMSGMFAILTMMYLAGVIIEKNISFKVVNLVISMITILIVFMSLSTSGFLTILCVTPFLLWLVIKSDKKIVTLLLLGVFIIFAGLGLHTLAQKNSKVWDETFGFFASSNPYEERAVSYNNSFGELLGGTTVSAADSKLELPVLPETGVGAGSGRMYIWEKTLNLVMDRPLFGYGLDSLMYNFPHYNIDARANLETETVVVDKPHNMYVGILYGTGLFGFISFMGIIIIILISSLKEIVKIRTSKNNHTVIFAVAWLAFLFQALFNDTLAGVAGPLWIISGVLMSSMFNKLNKPNLSS